MVNHRKTFPLKMCNSKLVCRRLCYRKFLTNVFPSKNFSQNRFFGRKDCPKHLTIKYGASIFYTNLFTTGMAIFLKRKI
jgi:hypothetical protein